MSMLVGLAIVPLIFVAQFKVSIAIRHYKVSAEDAQALTHRGGKQWQKLEREWECEGLVRGKLGEAYNCCERLKTHRDVVVEYLDFVEYERRRAESDDFFLGDDDSAALGRLGVKPYFEKGQPFGGKKYVPLATAMADIESLYRLMPLSRGAVVSPLRLANFEVVYEVRTAKRKLAEASEEERKHGFLREAFGSLRQMLVQENAFLHNLSGGQRAKMEWFRRAIQKQDAFERIRWANDKIAEYEREVARSEEIRVIPLSELLKC